MYRIRSIEPDDNAALATIITEVLASYGAVGDGYACADPEIQDMYGAYSRSGFGYYVLANADNIACGGGGFGALKDAPEGTCEIQKMYFLPSARGLGFGKQILHLAVSGARKAGYSYAYLETLPHMVEAIALYQQCGFQRLNSPLGSTGHHKCPVWMGIQL